MGFGGEIVPIEDDVRLYSMVSKHFYSVHCIVHVSVVNTLNWNGKYFVVGLPRARSYAQAKAPLCSQT